MNSRARRDLVFAAAVSAMLMSCGRKENPAAVETPAPPPPASAPATRIIAFGDSLTAGKDLADPDQEAWPAVLERMLRQKGFNVEAANAGHSGDTTFDALNRLDFTLSQGADVVIVAFGSNDTFQGKALKDIKKNLNEIVRRIKEKGADVVLCALKTFPNFGPDYAAPYEKIFPRVAARWDVPLTKFMLEGVAGAPALNLPDGIHPNARGHALVAANILPTVESTLKKRQGKHR